MIIDYQDKEKESIVLSTDEKNTALLNVAAFDLNGIHIQAKSFDLSAAQGDVFRLYAEQNGDLSTDKWNCHYWLLAEAVIPEKKTRSVATGKQDDNGNDIMTSEDVQLDLNSVEFKVFSLPEGENK